MSTKLREWLGALFQAAIFVIVLYFIFWPIRIDGDSMETNFHSNDRIVVSRIASYLNLIGYGDVVVCRVEIDGKTENVIKRLVAMPGDRVEIRDGKFILNGVPQAERYLSNPETSGVSDTVLGADEYFILGDNRPVSYDSRILGPVSHKNIVGRVILRWYPLKSFEIIR